MDEKVKYIKSRLLVFLMVLFLSPSCTRLPKQDFTGNWIGSKTLNQGNEVFHFEVTPLLEVNKDSICGHFINEYGDVDSFKYKYSIIKDKLHLKEDQEIGFKLRVLGKDSVAVSYQNKPDIEMVFYKIEAKERFKGSSTEFLGREFEFIGNSSDTVRITFFNDSLATQKNMKSGSMTDLKWRVLNQKENSYLILSNEIASSVLLIESNNAFKNTINLIGFPNDRKYTFKEIK